MGLCAGSQVTVMDSSGKVIGTGPLTYSASETTAALQSAAGSGVSTSTFTVTVPGGETRYGIQVGKNRGTIYFSAVSALAVARSRRHGGG